MSEILANKITPVTGTTVTLGDSGDTFTIPSGVTVANSGTATGFGKVVQVVHVQDGAVATGTTTIPLDDTTPQNTEGDEFMTLAITPTNASNKLEITVITNGSSSATGIFQTAALFQDSTAGALSAMTHKGPQSGTAGVNIAFKHRMTAGTTSSTTFKVRIGGHSASTITFNGYSAGRVFAGVMASSITITEISA